jgi:hypothetical protein
MDAAQIACFHRYFLRVSSRIYHGPTARVPSVSVALSQLDSANCVEQRGAPYLESGAKIEILGSNHQISSKKGALGICRSSQCLISRGSMEKAGEDRLKDKRSAESPLAGYLAMAIYRGLYLGLLGLLLVWARSSPFSGSSNPSLAK